MGRNKNKSSNLWLKGINSYKKSSDSFEVYTIDRAQITCGPQIWKYIIWLIILFILQNATVHFDCNGSNDFKPPEFTRAWTQYPNRTDLTIINQTRVNYKQQLYMFDFVQLW